MHGLHLTADLRGCAASEPALTDLEALRQACLDAIEVAGLGAVGELFHRYAPLPGATGTAAPAGITGVVLLAESHVAVHTWPELLAVTLDVYVCNVGRDNSTRADALLERLIGLFAPAAVKRHRLERGRVALSSGR